MNEDHRVWQQKQERQYLDRMESAAACRSRGDWEGFLRRLSMVVSAGVDSMSGVFGIVSGTG